MENIEELRREAEEVKEKLRKDILELRDILKRASSGVSDTHQLSLEDAVNKAEQHIEETVSNVEERFEKAIGLMTKSFPQDEDNITWLLDYKDFTNIEADCAFRVETIHSEKYNVSVRASKALIDEINVIKSGNTLKMSLKQHIYQSRPSVFVKIGMPLLNKIRLGAATRCTMRGFNSKENLDIRLTGNSVLDTDIIAGNARCEISGASRLIGKMELTDAEFILSGASRLELKGTAKNVNLNAWGASNAQIDNFVANDMTVHLNGASDAAINATGNIDIDLNSGSRLSYKNSPTIRSISVSGASSISHI